MTIQIAPFDDASKKRLINAVADIGKASGLEAAASILIAMAGGHYRNVPTVTVREIAEMLQQKASDIRGKAESEIKILEAQS